MPAVTIKNLNVDYVQGSTRELYADWAFTPSSENGHIESFHYVWQYYSNKKWFNGGEGDVSHDSTKGKKSTYRPRVTFSPPDNTNKVQIKVKAVSKTKKKDDKEEKYFTGSYSAWKVFNYTKNEVKTETISTKNITLTKNTSAGKVTINAAWTHSISSDVLSGFSYVWRVYSNGVWSDADSGEVARQITSVNYEVTEGVSIVKFSVTPVPIGTMFVGSASGWKQLELRLFKRSVADLNAAYVAKTDNTYLCEWTADKRPTAGITAYQWQRQYRGADNIWRPVESGSVNFDEPRKLPSGNVRTTWGFEYSVEQTAKEFRFRVKPESSLHNIQYTDEWSNFKTVKIKPAPPVEVKDLTFNWSPKTQRTVAVSWGYDGARIADTASFSYEWQYSYYPPEDKTNYLNGGSGSVDINAYSSRWMCTLDLKDDNVKKIRFRIKAVPKYAKAFRDEYPNTWHVWSASVDPQKVSTTEIKIVDPTTGTIQATWSKLSGYTVKHYEYKWRYSLTSSYGLWYDESPGTTTSTRTTYVPPDNVASLMFCVRPVEEYASEFTGQFNSWTTIKIDDLLNVRQCNNIVMGFQPFSNRTLDISWQIPSTSRVASFDYEIRYKLTKDGNLYSGTTGSKDVNEKSSTNPDKWLISYDIPENAHSVYFNVTPVPNSQLAFRPAPTGDVIFLWKVDERHVNTPTIKPYTDLTDRTLEARWTISGDTSNIESYEVQWAYFYNDLWRYESVATVDPINTFSTYQVPDESTKAGVKVRPIPKYECSFFGEWTDLVGYSIVAERVDFDTSNLTIRRRNASSRTLVLNWTLPGYTPTTYDVEWSYYSDGIWSTTDKTDSIPGTADPLQSEYDSPETATIVRARVKPNFDNDPTKESDWTGYIEYEWDIPTFDVDEENITLFMQRGSNRTVVAVWTADPIEGLVSYDYEWAYTVDNVMFAGNSGSATPEIMTATYDAPEIAGTAKFRVRPVPETESYFVGDWTEYVQITLPATNIPAAPSAPNVSIDKFTLTAYLDTYDTNLSVMEFEVVNTSKIWRTVQANVLFNRATVSVPVEVGETYRVRARGFNDDGEPGEWSEYSADISTIPAVITGTINISATSSTSAELTWPVPKGKPTSYTIEYTSKKRYFDAAPDQVKNTTVSQIEGQSTMRAEITGIEASEDGEWFFRIKSTNDQGDSEWSKIVSIVLGTIPDAPTTWSSTMTATVDRDVYLFWVHNSEDGSRETSAELELNVNGTVTTLTIPKDPDDDTTSYYIIEAGTYPAGAKINWRVRTKGVLPDYGDWSLSRLVEIFAPPTLSISYTSGVATDYSNTITSFPITINAVAGPMSQTPVGYSVTITSNSTYDGNDDVGNARRVIAGEIIYNRYFISSEFENNFVIGPGDVNLENSMNYTIRVVVSMNSGLSAEAEAQFSVAWGDVTYYLDASLMYDADIVGMYITPYCNDENGALIANVTLGVYRREFDGSFTEIATGLSNTTPTTVVDPHPALDYARYRITARSESTGYVEYYDLPGYLIGETSIILQWNETMSSYTTFTEDAFSDRPYNGSFLKLPFNVDVNDSNTVDSQLIEYIGRKHPVSYYGTQVGQKLSLASDIAKTDVETIYALRRLAVWMGDVYVREPSGSGYWAKVEVSFNQTHLETVIPVSLSITRVEGGV